MKEEENEDPKEVVAFVASDPKSVPMVAMDGTLDMLNQLVVPKLLAK